MQQRNEEGNLRRSILGDLGLDPKDNGKTLKGLNQERFTF